MKRKQCEYNVPKLRPQYLGKLFREGQGPVVGVSFAKAKEEKLLSVVV